MTIRMSEVKALCTPSEQSLVAASRKPQVQSLDAGTLRANAQRARKLLEKWQDRARAQGRTRSRQVGFGEEAARSRRKAEIFAEALARIQTQLEKLEADQTKTAGRKKPKAIRARENRSARANVRKRLSKQQEILNREEDKRKRAVLAKPSAPSQSEPRGSAEGNEGAEHPAGQQPDTATKGRKPRTPLRPPAMPLAARQSGQLGLDEQPNFKLSNQATTAAKQARIARSGLTTRVRGHVSARGRRVQGRRDQRNG